VPINIGIAHRFKLVDNVWTYLNPGVGHPVNSAFEVNADIIDEDTQEIAFAKTTTPAMDYTGAHWERKLVREKIS
jgi:hypothetical protein